MATKIVRITRHEAETSQTAVLKQFFGQDMEVIVVNETMPMESNLSDTCIPWPPDTIHQRLNAFKLIHGK